MQHYIAADGSVQVTDNDAYQEYDDVAERYMAEEEAGRVGRKKKGRQLSIRQ